MLDTYPLDEGLVDLSGMVSLHLSTRFYPPFPHDFIETMTPLVVEAIEHYVADDPRAVIIIPAGTEPVPRRASPRSDGSHFIEADNLIEITRLWPVVDSMMADTDD